MSDLLSTEELCAKFGKRRPGDLARYLREQGIAFFSVGGKPVTTIQAINRRLLDEQEGDWDVTPPRQ